MSREILENMTTVHHAETRDAAARDGVSKRIARERRSEERMRYSHKKTSERGLG